MASKSYFRSVHTILPCTNFDWPATDSQQ